MRILSSWLIRLVDGDDIADLEQAGLYRLDPVTEAGCFDHHDGVGRVRQTVLLRDGAELQLETDGQGSSLMGCATRSCEGS